MVHPRDSTKNPYLLRPVSSPIVLEGLSIVFHTVQWYVSNGIDSIDLTLRSHVELLRRDSTAVPVDWNSTLDSRGIRPIDARYDRDEIVQTVCWSYWESARIAVDIRTIVSRHCTPIDIDSRASLLVDGIDRVGFVDERSRLEIRLSSVADDRAYRPVPEDEFQSRSTFPRQSAIISRSTHLCCSFVHYLCEHQALLSFFDVDGRGEILDLFQFAFDVNMEITDLCFRMFNVIHSLRKMVELTLESARSLKEIRLSSVRRGIDLTRQISEEGEIGRRDSWMRLTGSNSHFPRNPAELPSLHWR